MRWSETLRIPAVRRKWLLDALTVFLLSVDIGVGAYCAAALSWLLWPALICLVLVSSIVFAYYLYFPSGRMLEDVKMLEIARREDDPEIWDMAVRLAARMDIPMPRLGIFHGFGEAAVSWDFIAGKGVAVEDAVAATIATGGGMLESCLAHEMAHLKNRDRRTTLIVQTLANAALTLGLLLVVASIAKCAFTGGLSVSSLTALAVGLFMTAFDYFGLPRLLEKMFQQHEFAADALGVAVTGDPLTTAATLMSVDLRAKSIEKQLRDAGVITGEDKGLKTHPETRDRVRALIGRDPP